LLMNDNDTPYSVNPVVNSIAPLTLSAMFDQGRYNTKKKEIPILTDYHIPSQSIGTNLFPASDWCAHKSSGTDLPTRRWNDCLLAFRFSFFRTFSYTTLNFIAFSIRGKKRPSQLSDLTSQRPSGWRASDSLYLLHDRDLVLILLPVLSLKEKYPCDTG
jgi:hypothetical protein